MGERDDAIKQVEQGITAFYLHTADIALISIESSFCSVSMYSHLVGVKHVIPARHPAGLAAACYYIFLMFVISK